MLCCSSYLHLSIVGTSWLIIISVPLYCYGSNYCNTESLGYPSYTYSHSDDRRSGSTAYSTLHFQHIYTHLSTMSHMSVVCLRSHKILKINQGTESAFSVLTSLLILVLSLSSPV